MNKKGVSGIILVVILAGLVIVAAGVVWVIFSDILGEERLSPLEECLEPIMEEYCESQDMILNSFQVSWRTLYCQEDEWHKEVQFNIPESVIEFCEVKE